MRGFNLSIISPRSSSSTRDEEVDLGRDRFTRTARVGIVRGCREASQNQQWVGVEEPVRGQVGPCCQRASLLWEEHQRRALEVVRRPEEVGLLSHEPASHVRRLLLVRVRVLHHPVLADEALAAHVAGEGLLAGVQAHVAAQVRLVVELLRAHLALVRLVPGVLGHVLLKQNKKLELCETKLDDDNDGERGAD